MIKKIYLENWKAHKKSEFDFDKGTNVIIGLMGAGKSSIMDALCFGLFGTFPSLNSKRVSIDEVLMNKPTRAEQSIITILFEYDNKEYLVERTILRKGTNSAKLYFGDKLIAGPKTKDVNKRIEDILEVDYDLFSRAVYSEQNQIDYFLKLGPAQRKEKFDELLGINTYEKVRGNAVTVLNRIKKILDDKDNILEQQKKQVRLDELNMLKEQLVKEHKEIFELEKQIMIFEKELNELKQKEDKLKKSETEFVFFKELLIRSNGRIEELKKTMKNVSENLNGRTFEQINEDLTKIEKEKKKIDQKIKETNFEIEKHNFELNKISEHLGSIKSRITEIEKANHTLENSNANCPVCKHPLTEASKKNILKEHEENMKKLQTENTSTIKNKQNNEEKILEYKKNIEKYAKEIDALNSEKNKTERLLEDVKKLEVQQKEFEDLAKEILKIEKQIKESNFDELEIRQVRESLIKKDGEISNNKNKIISEKALIEQIQKNIESIEKNQKYLQELEANITHLKLITDKLNIYINTLKATQAELRETLINTINNAMEDIWQNIYPYKDFTNVKIEIQNGNYEILAKEISGNWVKAEGILSGGERTSVAITLRVAIALILTRNLSWLILDEPTHNLDIQTIRQLSMLIREHLPQLVDQIFVITHEKEMENAATSQLYVLERDKSIDGITKSVLEQIE